ncbi:MAG: aminotransferase class IV [Thermoleophilia bacterium]|nr:aminotransferase class IV [Thermoleophilia bacterium]
MAYVIINGNLVPESAATVSVFDRGFAYGDSLIETLKILSRRPVFFAEHFKRLTQAMGLAAFESVIDKETLMSQVLSLAEANDVSDGRLRIQLSRGTPTVSAGVDPVPELTPTLLLTAESSPGYPEDLYSEGVKCVTVAANRGRYAPLKSGSLLPTIMARREAAMAGAWEALFTSGHGRLLEGSFTNIFFLASGRLLTAGEDEPLLAGVAREKVIGIAEDMGIEVEMKAPKLYELARDEDAAFLTNSLLGVCPVRDIDGMSLRQDTDIVPRLAARLTELEQADIK